MTEAETSVFFRTARLTARRFRPDDREFLCRMQGNARVMLHITGAAKTREESAEELNRILAAYRREGAGFLVMAVESTENRQPIGSCAVVDGEIGFRLDEPHWGQGFGWEIFKGLARYCLHTLGLEAIRAEVEESNAACVRILESGMTRTGAYPDAASGKRTLCYRLDRDPLSL